MLKVLRCTRTAPRISARLLSQSGTSCSKKFDTGNRISYQLLLINSVVDPEQFVLEPDPISKKIRILTTLSKSFKLEKILVIF